MLFAMFYATCATPKPLPVPPPPPAPPAAANQAGAAPVPAAPGQPAWRLLQSPVLNFGAAPGAAGQFDLQPLLTALPLLQSVLGADVYSEVEVPLANMIFDAVTAGYGGAAAVQLLLPANPALVNDICTYAQSRAPLLQSIYAFPGPGVGGPFASNAQSKIETTEKIHLSFVLGQTVAMCMARHAWGVPRLFHRSLYGPVLPNLCPGAPALADGLSPDFVCFVPLLGGAGVGLCFVESKGTANLIDHNRWAASRKLINNAFEHQIAPAHNALPGGAYLSAVSLACCDAAQGPNRVVGQFWDPPNRAALPVAAAGLHQITARYFLAMRSFLLSIGPSDAAPGGQRVEWVSPIMNMRIEMDVWQWQLMEELARGDVGDEVFYTTIGQLDAGYQLGAQGGHNGDGLYLSMRA